MGIFAGLQPKLLALEVACSVLKGSKILHFEPFVNCCKCSHGAKYAIAHYTQ